MNLYEIVVALAGGAVASGAVVAGVMVWWMGALSKKLAPVWTRLDEHATRLAHLEGATEGAEAVAREAARETARVEAAATAEALVDGHARTCPARASADGKPPHGPAVPSTP